MTTFYNKTSILAEFWLNYRYDQDFKDLFDYCDISLPLSWGFANYIVNPEEPTDLAVNLINEAWDLVLEALDVDRFIIDQLDLTSLDDLLGQAE